MSACELTILMPCLDEADTLASCIQKAKSFLQRENIHGEILIADNGSQDGSQEIAKQAGARILQVSTRGYGAALKAGIQAANGRYVIMGDADDSYDFQHLMPFIVKLRSGDDLVMGNRFQGGIQEGAMPFLNRYLGNPVLSFFGRIFFKSRVGDFHCGLRGFNRERLQQLNLQGNGMEFASEMVVKATLQQFNISEVPTVLSKDGRHRRPHLRPWRDGWRHLRLLLLFSPRWLFFYPGLMLSTLGLVLMSALMLGPIVIDGVSFDIHTMLFSSVFMMVGMQAICFSVFANHIAETQLHLVSKNYIKKIFTLERGLIIGLLLILLGAIGAIYSFCFWQQHAFGPLSPTEMMRILIPALTTFIIGIQIVFSSFFMSLLNVHISS